MTKILIVYYSRDGHTHKVAEDLKNILQADIERLEETNLSRKGIWGWLISCKDSFLKTKPILKTLSVDPLNYDLVIIGSPVWAFNMTPAVRNFLNQYGKQLKKTALFVTLSGAGDKRALQAMEKLCANTPITTMKFIDRRIDRNEHQGRLETFSKAIRELA